MILGRFSPISHKVEHWFNEALLVMGQGAMTTHWQVTWTEDVDGIDYFVGVHSSFWVNFFCNTSVCGVAPLPHMFLHHGKSCNIFQCSTWAHPGLLIPRPLDWRQVVLS
jgi:hypothetical protein